MPDISKPDVAFQTLINTDLVINTDQKQDEKSKPKKKIAQKLDFSCWPTLPDPQVLNDWKTLRKGKRTAITQTVLNHLGKVMHRAGNELGLSVDAERLVLNQIVDQRTCRFKPTGMLTNLPAVAEAPDTQTINSVLGIRIMDRMRANGGKWILFQWESYRK